MSPRILTACSYCNLFYLNLDLKTSPTCSELIPLLILSLSAYTHLTQSYMLYELTVGVNHEAMGRQAATLSSIFVLLFSFLFNDQ